MTYFPQYLKTYPNMNTSFPFHLGQNRLKGGFPAHRHDFLEFSYVVEGSGAESVNGVLHPMVPGTFTFVLPYQVHELFTDPGSTLVLYNCMFSMDLLMEPAKEKEGGLSGLLDDTGGLPPFVQFEAQVRDAMRELMDDMYGEYNGEAWGRVALLKAKLAEALIRFDRFRRQRVPTAEAPRPDGKRERPVWPIIHYIHQHYQEENLMLAELADRFSMSVSRISEVIKETTGQAYIQFLHDLRIRHAASLLVSTDMSVTEIAHEVGYGSYKTFARIFRERKGVVPTAYRKRKGGGG